jgi:two-component sensor histidine kinase
MASDRCWRLGMIVYELVNNAARHAFNGVAGKISVEWRRVVILVECRVSDNGAASHKIGAGRALSIVDELVRRLEGKI